MSAKYISNNWRLLNQENSSSKNDNYGLTFDGSGEYIDCTNDILVTGTTSFSFWFKADNTTQFSTILDISDGTSTNRIWIGLYTGNIWAYAGKASSARKTTLSYSADTWYHIVVNKTASADISDIYVNGVAETLISSGASFGGSHSGFRIGRQIGYSTPFDGSISQVSIYDYTLTSTQISTLYGSSSLGSGNPMALKPQPVAYYPLGDNSASNPLTQPNVAVEDASVFDFDGSKVEVSNDAALQINGDITISAWVYAESDTGRVVSKRGGGGTNYDFYIESRYLRLYDGGTGPFSTGRITLNQWTHILISVTSGTGTYYINNVAAGTGTFSISSVGTSQPFFIGGAYTPVLANFDGKMSNVQVWSVGLSASDVTTLYNSGVPLYTGTQPQAANLKSWYKLNNTANWEADSSGNWQIPEANSAYPQSFEFNDTTDAINVSGISLGTVHTINFWVNFKPPYSTRDAYILSSGTVNGWVVYATNGGLLYYKAGSSTYSSGTMTAPTSSGVGEWHNITITRNGANINFYQNGNTTPFATTSTFAGASTPLGDIDFISADRSYGSDIRYSNFTFYDTELTSANVETLYNNGSPLTSAIASSNLKAWYKLDNSSTFSTNWVVENSAITSNFNKAIDFVSSSTQYIDLTNTGFPTGNAARTMSAWIKSDSTGQNNEQGILRYGTKSTRQLFMMSLAASNGRLRVSTYGDDLTYSTDDLRDDAWHHVALTYDGTSIKGYVDGSYVGVETNTLVNTTANLPAIGNWNNSGFTFNGAISNVLLYTETLTDANILTLYNNGTPQTTPYGSPFGWWKLDNLITGIQDSGSGGNNGTLVNSPLLTSTDVQSGSGISSGMTEQNLVNNNVSALNGESSGMTSANLVTSDLTRAIPYDNYSFKFDSASSDYIEVPKDSTQSFVNTDFCISIWLNPDISHNALVFMNYASNNGWGVYYNSGNLRFRAYPSAWQTLTTINTNEWTHILIVGDDAGDNLLCYKNGVEVYNSSYTLSIVESTDNVYIGSQNGSAFFFDGKISNISIFNEALTSTEALKLYSNGVPQDLSSFTPQPLAWHPLGSNSFWNGSAWTCRDMSTGGSNDGTSANIGADGLVGDAPRSEANGTGTNNSIPENLVGNTKWSDSNSWSVNMSSEARKQDTP